MTWNPFDWPANPFLTLYAALAAFVFLLGFRARSMIGPVTSADQSLDMLELAFLSGGAHRVGDVVLLRLLSEKGATVTPKGKEINVTDRKLLMAVTGGRASLDLETDVTRQQFQLAVAPAVERIKNRLQRFGYCPTDDQITRFRVSVLPFVAILLLFGIIKVAVGAARHHPVGFLTFLLLFTVLAGILMAMPPMRTRAGTRALEAVQAVNARAASAPLDGELVLAVALSGAVVLSGTAYASVHAASQRLGNNGEGGGGCSGGGCGGGGCGGCS